MGNLPFFQGAEENEEEAEQQELEKWRPHSDSGAHAALKRKKLSSKSSESDDTGSHGGQSADSESVASSASKMEGSVDSDDASGKGDDEDKESKGSKDEDEASSEGGSEGDKDEQALAKKGDTKRKKKIVVRMEFEPLLALHEPLAAVVEEPAEIFAAGKKKAGKMSKAEKAAIDDAAAECRQKAKEAVIYFNMTYGDDPYAACPLRELAAAIGQDPDELRYALEQAGRFTIDEDGNVHKTLLSHVFDAMNNDIETKEEVVNRLLDSLSREYEERVALEESIVVAARDSGGQLRTKMAKDVELYEQVDIEAEEALMKQEEKEERTRAKEEKKRAKGKRGRGKSSDDEDDESSSEEEDGISTMNKEAEKKALAFRRVQVQRKIEEFLKAYTAGQNLVKINHKGKRYHRRVYVDTTKRALVVQGASGPKFFPFASMREVDIETRTTKEGRVETLVICAIEKGGRIVKELNLAFPDQAKANTFVNCVTLFALALRNPQAAKK